MNATRKSPLEPGGKGRIKECAHPLPTTWLPFQQMFLFVIPDEMFKMNFLLGCPLEDATQPGRGEAAVLFRVC